MFPADNFKTFVADVKTLLTVETSLEWNTNVVSSINFSNDTFPVTFAIHLYKGQVENFSIFAISLSVTAL